MLELLGSAGALVAVVTVGGTREFLIYGADEPWRERLVSLTERAAGRRLSIAVHDDATWQAFAAVLAPRSASGPV